jgi:hypothetical protein
LKRKMHWFNKNLKEKVRPTWGKKVCNKPMPLKGIVKRPFAYKM